MPGSAGPHSSKGQDGPDKGARARWVEQEATRRWAVSTIIGHGRATPAAGGMHMLAEVRWWAGPTGDLAVAWLCLVDILSPCRAMVSQRRQVEDFVGIQTEMVEFGDFDFVPAQPRDGVEADADQHA